MLADSMECYYLRYVEDLLSDGQTPFEKAFWRTMLWVNITLRSDG